MIVVFDKARQDNGRDFATDPPEKLAAFEDCERYYAE